MDWRDELIKEGLTFSDLLLRPRRSELSSRLDPNTTTRLTKKIRMAIPVVSANMDTVTENVMAMAMARVGGVGIFHRNCTIEEEVAQVIKVKSAEDALIKDPYTLSPNDYIWQANRMLKEKGIDSVLIIDKEKRLVGMVTKHEIWNAADSERIKKYMRPRQKLIVAEKDPPLNEKEARKIAERVFARHHMLSKVPFVDKAGRLVALLTHKDLIRLSSFSNATKDEFGRLRVGAAVGVSEDALDRASALLGAGADVLVLDVAHGHAVKPMDIAKLIRRRFPDAELIVGNVATFEAVRDYARLRVSAIKVGIGPGATCSTRIVSGAGVPQVSALLECAREAGKYNIPIIADGGIVLSGDVSISIACGASSVMVGALFAGTDESPGILRRENGKLYKIVRGMSSFDVNAEIRGIKFMEVGIQDFIEPEGVPGRVLYSGPLVKVLGGLVGGLRSGMTYVGAKNIAELQRPFSRKFSRVSRAAREESKPHDIEIS